MCLYVIHECNSGGSSFPSHLVSGVGWYTVFAQYPSGRGPIPRGLDVMIPVFYALPSHLIHGTHWTFSPRSIHPGGARPSPIPCGMDLVITVIYFLCVVHACNQSMVWAGNIWAGYILPIPCGLD